MVYSSVIETLNQLIIAADLEMITNDDLVEGRTQIQFITMKVAALRKSQLAKARQSKP